MMSFFVCAIFSSVCMFCVMARWKRLIPFILRYVDLPRFLEFLSFVVLRLQIALNSRFVVINNQRLYASIHRVIYPLHIRIFIFEHNAWEDYIMQTIKWTWNFLVWIIERIDREKDKITRLFKNIIRGKIMKIATMNQK